MLVNSDHPELLVVEVVRFASGEQREGLTDSVTALLTQKLTSLLFNK